MSDSKNGIGLDLRLARLTQECPALIPYFVESIAMLEKLEIEVDDVATILRVYRTSPSFVQLLLRMMDIAVGGDNNDHG